MTEYQRNAVVIGDIKNAALYFDHIVPVFLGLEMVTDGWLDRDDWENTLKEIVGKVLPPTLMSSHFGYAFSDVNEKTYHLLQKFGIQQHGLEPRIKGLSKEEYDNIEETAARAYFSFVNEFALNQWPLATEGEPTTAGLPEAECPETTPLLTLSKLNVIDASNLTWDHIHEIREDPKAREQLRRLRLFAYSNYLDKPREFVEDDLLSRIDDYEATAKEWGVKTVQGTLTLALNSKLLAGGLAGSFVAAMFGQPMTAIVAGTATAIVEVSKFALELQSRKLAIESMARDNPISYVSYMRKRISKKTTANKAN